ncbi:MAG TPA: amidohydrolase family protein [Vicinamibacteria bacterium]
MWPDDRLADLRVSGGTVAEVAGPGKLARGTRELDLEGRWLLPGLVNAHDHLDFSTFPPLGRPPYASVYEWAAQVDGGSGDPAAAAALAVPLPDRLFLGGLRNLLAGVTAVAHHNAFHRSLARPDFPVRVLQRYQFAHSPGLTPELRRTYRTTDRRVPWMVHLAEGTDARCGAELAALIEANVLRQNTVIIHGIALPLHEMARLAAARACVVWCPESNRRLYGASAPVKALRQAGVRVGLGSDSPVSGVRDPLSNLAAARGEDGLGDEALLTLATRESAEVARLPLGAATAGAAADFVVVDEIEALLEGRRRAVALVVTAGQPLYGDAELMAEAVPRSRAVTVDGRAQRLAEGPARRAAALLRAHAGLARLAWLADVVWS